MTPTAIRRTNHRAALCVCWNYFEPHLARAICSLANIHEGRASIRWDRLAPDEQDHIEAVIHTMAEACEERAA